MSPIEEAIWHMSAEHLLDDRTDEKRFKANAKKKRLCQMATNDEARFMNLLFLHMVKEMAATEALPHVHKFYYTPHRRSERFLGYDMSIGYYRDHNRMNTMHKLINEQWCDQPWSWSSAKDTEKRAKADNNNVRTLLRRRGKNNLLLPYLIVNLCYCVHEYRRMGKRSPDRSFVIPDIASPLRTVIVDIQKLSESVPTWAEELKDKAFRLIVAREETWPIKADSPVAYLNAFSEQTELCVTVEPSGTKVKDCFISIEALCKKAKNLWENHWKDQVAADVDA